VDIEINNFGIHCSEHFSSSFGRKTRSKSPKSKHSRYTQSRTATSHRPERRVRRARRAQAAAASASGQAGAPSRDNHGPSPGCTHPQIASKSPFPCHAFAADSTGHCPSVRPLSPRTRRPEATAPRCGPSPSSEARGSSLFKADALLLVQARPLLRRAHRCLPWQPPPRNPCFRSLPPPADTLRTFTSTQSSCHHL
jgi:hypothetical protein